MGKTFDLLTIRDELESTRSLDKIGGPARLSELADAFGTTVNLAHHVKIIKEKYLLRRVIDLSERMVDTCLEPKVELSVVWDEFVAEMAAISGDTKSVESRQNRSLTEDVREWVLETSEPSSQSQMANGYQKHR